MSPQSSSNQPVAGPVQKQNLNVYTVMLIVSFAALLIGCLLLLFELMRYGAFPWWKTEGSQPAAPVSQLHAPLDPHDGYA